MKTLRKIGLLVLFTLDLIAAGQVNGMKVCGMDRLQTRILFGESFDRVTEATTDAGKSQLEELSSRLLDRASRLFGEKKLHLFDGSDGANQCHINALMVVLLCQGVPILSEHNIPRFLALNLLLSRASEGNKRPEILSILLDLNSTEKLKITSNLKNALKSGKSQVILQAKHELLALKARFFDEHLCCLEGNTRWSGLSFNQGDTAILPKFVGIFSVIEFLKKKAKIWTVIKCKTKTGKKEIFFIGPDQHSMFTQGQLHSLALKPSDPLMVIEGITTDRSAGLLNAMDPEEMQFANAATWMILNQPSACAAKLPKELRSRFDDAVRSARNLRVGPLAERIGEVVFSIQHMFPSTVGRELA